MDISTFLQILKVTKKQVSRRRIFLLLSDSEVPYRLWLNPAYVTLIAQVTRMKTNLEVSQLNPVLTSAALTSFLMHVSTGNIFGMIKLCLTTLMLSWYQSYAFAMRTIEMAGKNKCHLDIRWWKWFVFIIGQPSICYNMFLFNMWCAMESFRGKTLKYPRERTFPKLGLPWQPNLIREITTFEDVSELSLRLALGPPYFHFQEDGVDNQLNWSK